MEISFMEDLSRLIEKKAASSVKFNGIYYPANSVCEAAYQPIVRLSFGNDDYPEYPLSFFGSATKIKQGNKYVLLTTAHQYKAHGIENVMLETKSSKHWTSGSAFIGEVKADGELDLVLIDFSRSVNSGEVSKSGWIKFDNDTHYQELVGCIAMGYPSAINNSYADTETIKTSCTALLGELIEAKIPHRKTIQLESRLEYEADGLSDGPVFLVCRSGKEFSLEFGGIMTNANREIIHFVHSNHVQTLL